MMRWEIVDPIQPIDAMLVRGSEAAAKLAAAMEGKAAFQRGLPIALGEGWAALFARPLPGESEAMAPRIDDAICLFEAQKGWFFPVGCALAVPDDLANDLLQRVASEAGVPPPAIIVPRFGEGQKVSSAVDIYPVRLQSQETVWP